MMHTFYEKEKKSINIADYIKEKQNKIQPRVRAQSAPQT